MKRSLTLEICCGVLLLLTLAVLLGGYFYRKTLNSNLMKEAVLGNLPAVKSLVRRGADLRYHDNVGFTPLYQATHGGHPQVVRWLLAHGADPNAADVEGWTPLMTATGHVDYATSRALIEGGADVNAVNHAGETPLRMLYRATTKHSLNAPIETLLRRAGARH